MEIANMEEEIRKLQEENRRIRRWTLVLEKSLDDAEQKNEKQRDAFDKLMMYNADYRVVNELLRDLIWKICQVDGDVVSHLSGLERALREFSGRCEGLDIAKRWCGECSAVLQMIVHRRKKDHERAMNQAREE